MSTQFLSLPSPSPPRGMHRHLKGAGVFVPMAAAQSHTLATSKQLPPSQPLLWELQRFQAPKVNGKQMELFFVLLKETKHFRISCYPASWGFYCCCYIIKTERCSVGEFLFLFWNQNRIPFLKKIRNPVHMSSYSSFPIWSWSGLQPVQRDGFLTSDCSTLCERNIGTGW